MVLEEVLLVVLQRVDARALVLDLVVEPLQDLPPRSSPQAGPGGRRNRSARKRRARMRRLVGRRDRVEHSFLTGGQQIRRARTPRFIQHDQKCSARITR